MPPQNLLAENGRTKLGADFLFTHYVLSIGARNWRPSMPLSAYSIMIILV